MILPLVIEARDLRVGDLIPQPDGTTVPVAIVDTDWNWRGPGVAIFTKPTGFDDGEWPDQIIDPRTSLVIFREGSD